MAFETSPLLKIVDMAFTIARLGIVFVLWNRFVPVWKYKKDDSGDRYFQKNEVAAIFVILAAMGVTNAFITTNLPIFTVELFGVIIPYVLIREKEWTKESIFSLILFWNITSMSYFIVTSLTDYVSNNLMNGIEKASDIERFMSVRLAAFEFLLFSLYTAVCIVAVIPFMKVVKMRERISLQELVFLSVQNIAGVVMTFIMRHIAVLTISNGAFILTEEEPQLLWQMPIVALLLYFGELSAVFMWQENNRNRKRSEMYLAEKLEKEAMRKRLEQTQDYYEKIRKVRHDMVTHLTNIKALSEHGYEAELAAYIEELDADIRSVEMAVSTGNAVTDMVINDRIRKAKAAEVLLSVDVCFNDGWGISAYDLGIVIGNLLDNAICAAERARDKNVSFRVKENQGVVLVLCENSYVPNAEDESPKNEWHGLGLKNVEDIADRYDGGMRIDKEQGVFSVTVMLKKQKK